MANKIYLTHTEVDTEKANTNYVPALGEAVFITPNSDEPTLTANSDISKRQPAEGLGGLVDNGDYYTLSVGTGDLDLIDLPPIFAQPMYHTHSEYSKIYRGTWTPIPVEGGSVAAIGKGYFTAIGNVVHIWGKAPVWGGGALEGLPFGVAHPQSSDDGFFPVFASSSTGTTSTIIIGVLWGSKLVANSKTLTTTISNSTNNTITQGSYFSAWYVTDQLP